jgi:hypothetical protein
MEMNPDAHFTTLGKRCFYKPRGTSTAGTRLDFSSPRRKGFTRTSPKQKAMRWRG